jgi:tetratricopeptide (TPR) repeat protein
MAHSALKSYAKAMRDFERALTIDRAVASSTLYYEMGKASLQMGHLDRAIADFSKAIEMKPSYGLAFANRGVAYRNRGDYSRAMEDFRNALTHLTEPKRVAAVRDLLKEAEKRATAARPKPPSQVSGTARAGKELRPLW